MLFYIFAFDSPLLRAFIITYVIFSEKAPVCKFLLGGTIGTTFLFNFPLKHYQPYLIYSQVDIFEKRQVNMPFMYFSLVIFWEKQRYCHCLHAVCVVVMQKLWHFVNCRVLAPTCGALVSSYFELTCASSASGDLWHYILLVTYLLECLTL